MKNIILFIIIFFAINSNAQIIRKNYRELSDLEVTDYNAALQALWNSGSSTDNNHFIMANAHAVHFGTNIHRSGGGQNFPSFHRFFLLHWELLLKNTNAAYAYLNIPYWDWRSDPLKSNLPVNAVNYPNFWAYAFLPLNNFISWGVTRPTTFNSANSSSLPTFSSYNAALSESVFLPNFRANLEISNHDGPHVYIGGTMASASSPLDPVFYLHHAMVDKIWQDWEDQYTGEQSIFPSIPYNIPFYNTDANLCIDSRNIPFRLSNNDPMLNYDVWYAQNGKVVLDGANGVDFVVNGKDKIYRYTTKTASGLGGDIFIGDLKRNANDNIVPDNKGGFKVPPGITAHFRAGGRIILSPGTTIKADNSSKVTFKIINTPNGF